MSNYLADVVMPSPEISEEHEKLPPDIPEADPPCPMPLTDEVIQEQLDAEDDESTYEVEEDPIPEPVRRRKKIPQDEIFTPPKVKTILDPDSLKYAVLVHEDLMDNVSHAERDSVFRWGSNAFR